ncbi:gp45 family putative tail fiber system protein [Listeria ivanovii]|uniref:gp45 family putative tail fiber system protein n=1 Tax=Listeria ivanovii TaxID=1638 RepID=UPI003CF539F8
MAERVFCKSTPFGESKIFVDDRTKMIANPAFKQKIALVETGCEKMVEYIEELKLKGYEEVTR